MNPAFELGQQQYPWWPDWRGQVAAIVASGPSTGKFPVEQLRGACKVIAIKRNAVDKTPWADVCYGCDDAWWMSVKGLQDFKGLKFSYGSKATARYPDIHKINIERVDRILTDKPLTTGSGKNSGFQALNLAIQFGATRILLIGYDFSDRGGTHWYGRNTAHGMSNPGEHNFKAWRLAMQNIAGDLVARGIDVINASAVSTLTCFRRGGLEDLLGRVAA